MDDGGFSLRVMLDGLGRRRGTTPVPPYHALTLRARGTFAPSHLLFKKQPFTFHQLTANIRHFYQTEPLRMLQLLYLFAGFNGHCV